MLPQPRHPCANMLHDDGLMFDQWEDLFLSGAFAPRAVLLRGLTLDEASTVPDGAPHSIYQELWHATKVLQQSLENGRVVLESWPLEEHFPASAAPPDQAAWEALVSSFLEASQRAVDLAQDQKWLASPDPGYERFGLTWRDALEFLAVHTAYHLGKVVAIRQRLGSWPPAS